VLKELIKKERQYLKYFFDHLDVESAEQILKIIHQCKGVMIFSGVGKSGLVAKKIAVTMISIGSKALYLSPIDSLHGDLGMVRKEDVVILLSKSGETEELMHLIPFVRNKGAQLIAIVSNPGSRLAKACDYSINLPLEHELCPFDMVPTISTSIQMIFGDILAVALMDLNKFSLDQFATNHPSGRIGRRITVKVKDLMITGEGIPLCKVHDKLVDTLVELSNKRCGCLIVIDDHHKLLGIFTDGDLRRSLLDLGSNVLEQTVGSLMTQNPKSIDSEVLAWEAMQKMEADQKHPITVLPVLKGEEVIGIIKMHDIVQSGI
jgi:arabinose-5-phosphate isomerase